MYRSLVPGKGPLNALRHKGFGALYVIGTLVCFRKQWDYTRRMIKRSGMVLPTPAATSRNRYRRTTMSGADSTLTQARLKELMHYDPDTGVFVRIAKARGAKVGKSSWADNGHGHIRMTVDGVQYVAHRLAWFYVHGVWPIKFLDHINGNRQDNRICNLRECDDELNQQNRHAAPSHSSTRLIGATPHQGRFRAQIRVKKKLIRLGCFDTAEEAHAAYLKAKRELHEFCTI